VTNVFDLDLVLLVPSFSLTLTLNLVFHLITTLVFVFLSSSDKQGYGESLQREKKPGHGHLLEQKRRFRIDLPVTGKIVSVRSTRNKENKANDSYTRAVD
jgi:hypothetical protein